MKGKKPGIVMYQNGSVMIELALIIAYSVFFIHVTTWEGHIFEEVANVLDMKLPEWITKPLYGCPICMTFWYGFLIQWIFFEITLMSILITFAAGGINVINAILAKWFQQMVDSEEIDEDKRYAKLEQDIKRLRKEGKIQ